MLKSLVVHFVTIDLNVYGQEQPHLLNAISRVSTHNFRINKIEEFEEWLVVT